MLQKRETRLQNTNIARHKIFSGRGALKMKRIDQQKNRPALQIKVSFLYRRIAFSFLCPVSFPTPANGIQYEKELRDKSALC